MKRIIILGMAVMLAACGAKQGNDKKAELEKLKTEYKSLGEKIKTLEAQLGDGKTDSSQSKLVSLTKVETSAFNHFIEVQGTVESDDNVLVGPKQPGFAVSNIYVKAGDNVKAGQVLADADASPLQNQLSGLQANLSLATTAFERQQNLWNQKIGTEFQFLQAKTQKESLEKNIASLQSQISNTKIVAPFDGVVDEVKVKVGEMAAMGFSGIRVVNTCKMKVKAKLADAYINKVHRGNKVMIELPDDNANPISSSLTYAGSVVDPITRTFNVEVLMTGCSQLKPNMVTNLKINDATINKAVVINQNLIQTSEDGKFVMVAEHSGNKIIAKRAIVKTGDSYNGNIIITDGLKEGDEMITSGYQDLIDGQEVKL